jgi:quercetin dioxygenase-like cupin family protein
MPDEKKNYVVKNVETIMSDAHAQARVLALGPGQEIPWHRHSEITDHYFVLRGKLTINMREPDSRRELHVGDRKTITPGSGHLLSNRET